MSESWGIRQEENRDHGSVEKMIKKAFESLEISDHKEHYLVDRLRKSQSFVPELALVAEAEDQLVGYILLTEISIKSKNEELLALSLAPVAVDPEFQNLGIGSALIREAHRIARKKGYAWIILVGHEDFYPRFGYELTHLYKLSFGFEVPPENGFVLNLLESEQRNLDGLIVYPKAFFGHQERENN